VIAVYWNNRFLAATDAGQSDDPVNCTVLLSYENVVNPLWRAGPMRAVAVQRV